MSAQTESWLRGMVDITSGSVDGSSSRYEGRAAQLFEVMVTLLEARYTQPYHGGVAR